MYSKYAIGIQFSHMKSQWGYDAQVMNFFDKSGQCSIYDHAQQLLQDITIERAQPEEVCMDLVGKRSQDLMDAERTADCVCCA